MKRLTLLLIFLMFIFAGCDSTSPKKCKESVEKEFPNFKVISIPGEPYSFLMKDKNGNLWLVKTLTLFSPDISSIRKIDEFNCKD